MEQEKVFKKRKMLSPKQRWLILKRDGFKCKVCGATQEQSPLTVDHIIPVSKGGTNDENNLRTLCSECNLGKRDSFDSQPNFDKEIPRLPNEKYSIESIFVFHNEQYRC